jgi:phosphoribosylanthranilate isomerase
MWIKICGLTDPNQARSIAALRPDAIGLNFYSQSPRFVSVAAARKIADAVGPQIERIGVFVEPSDEELRRTVADCNLSGVQIHAADEQGNIADISYDAGTSVTRWICGLQVGEPGLAHLKKYFESRGPSDRSPDACLTDALVPGMHGGTGRTAPWHLLRDEYCRDEWPPLILAGGLRPENVAEAIATVRPWGVDVASGIESSPGIKDLARVAQFVLEARRAFAKLEPARSKAGG